MSIKYITQDTSIFVSPSGDDSNDGMTPQTSFKSLQAACNYIKTFDHNNHTMTMVIADGIYLGGFACTGAIVGNVEFQVVGNMGHPENVIIQIPQNGIGAYAKDYGAFTIQGVTFQSLSTGCVHISAGQFGIVDFDDVIFGFAPQGIHINVIPFGSVNALNGYAITGGAICHINNNWGNIDYQSLNANNSSVSMFNNPTWTTAGIVTSGGRTYLGNTNFGGTGGIGPRWQTSGTGKIITDGVNPDNFAIGDQNGVALG